MKEFFSREWICSDKVLAVATAFLSGLVLGFLFSPVKKGIYCGNHNGNTQAPEAVHKKP